jgi:hypothetical protein
MREEELKNNRDTLEPGEFHPATNIALDYILTIPYHELKILQESFSSCAIEGNRLAEICAGTLRRLLHGEPVSDRYLMGLAWAITKIKSPEAE